MNIIIQNMSSLAQTQKMSATAKSFVPMSKKAQDAKWAFDTNSRNENGIVVCIPRVFKNITKQRVFACMVNTNWGRIDKVDLILGKNFNKAFVHFLPGKFNVDQKYPKMALDRMLKGEQVIFTYDVNDKHPEGWFWKIGISTSVRPKFRKSVEKQPRTNPRRKRTLDLSGKGTKVIVPQVVTDAELLLRKNENQKARSPRDDPIMARQLEHNAILAIGYRNGSLELVEDGAKSV